MMGKSKSELLLVCALVLVTVAGSTLGDWDPCDPHKMHYPQEPDPCGWDVAWNNLWALGDDWECSETGPVTDIHFWISWMYGEGEPCDILNFNVEIWSNNPGDACMPWSHPNEPLWGPRGYQAGMYTYRYVDTDWQGWFDPASWNWWDYDHIGCWQINITDIDDPFIQQEGEIYWLVINDVVISPSVSGVGWKESGSPHFMDDAVWWDGDWPPYWEELKDPETQQTMDLAFVITGEEDDPNIKWEQPPDPCYCGLHAHDYHSGFDYERLILADDWLCEGGVVTDLHWWGAIEDIGAGLTGFHLSIHANNDPCCLPADPALWQADIPIGSITATPTGAFNNCGEEIIKYEYLLPPIEYFYQESGNTYWFNVCALSNDPCNPCLWKWQETGRNPVPILCPAADKLWPVPDIWNSIDWGEAYSDMAFVITSSEQEEPNQPTKYIQNPDLSPTGIDVDASMDLMGMGPWADHVLADDFPCTRTDPITDIHVWGSWYQDELPYGEPNNVSFTLSIHADLPVGDSNNPYNYSIPGEILWMRDFMPDEFEVAVEAQDINEGYYVPDTNYYEANADWTCWRYDFYIDPCEAFIQQGDPCNPVVYWLSVQALTDSMSSPARFGWKTSLEHWNDDAVWAKGDAWSHEPWQELRYPLGHQYYPESIDLAFSITTGHEPNEPNDTNEPEPNEPNYAKPLMPHTKWSQPPIEIDPNSTVPTYCGWYEDSDNLDVWRIVADDFRCLGTMPVTSIHWWGGYIGWEGNEPPTVKPEAWQIGFWSNIADPNPYDPNTFSHPDELLWQIEVDANQTTEPSLISYWKFNEGFGTVASDSANGNDGAIYGATWTAGKEGTALYFHGGGQWASGSDSVRVPHSANLDITGPFTVEAWIKAEGTDKYHMIVDKHDGSAAISYGFSLYLTDGNLRLSIYSGANGNGGVYSTKDLRDNKWHHVAGLWGGGQGKIFVDGVLEGQASWAYAPASTSYDLGIGKRLYGWGGYLPFLGTIDEVTIYDSNLSEDRIEQHYEEGLAGLVYDVVKYGDCYQHNVYLEPNEYFWQDDYSDLTEDRTFWLSIMAVYPNDVDVNFLWGWKTRPWHWMDDAVAFPHEGPLEPGMTLDPCSIEPIKDPNFGESFDLAFELDTDPCYIKWEQLYTGIRHWQHYEDEMSIAGVEPTGEPNIIRLVADDWLCKRKTPITAAAWWGSYIGYTYQACTGPPMVQPDRPDYFLLNIWTDVPADSCVPGSYSHPNEAIWEYRAYDYDEVLVGYDKHPEASGSAGASAAAGSSDRPSTTPYLSEATIADTAGRVGANNAAGCLIPCPPGATIENEPNCGVPDTYNGGCNNTPPVFSPISCGETYCSTAGYDGVTRDTDWYEITVTQDAVFTWIVEADFDVAIGLVETIPDGSGDCSDATGLLDPNAMGPACVPVSVTTDCLPPGTYWFFVGPLFDQPEFDCNDYVATLICEPCAGKEPVFRYSVRLPQENWFCQDSNDSVYWFSVVAVYDQNVPNYDWGWTNHEHVYNDDAVEGYLDPPAGWSWYELFDQTQASEDMSFILFTEPGCFPCTHPDYSEWLYVGKPGCWCYPRQCHGDADGLPYGKSNYWASIPDLTILKAAWNKPLGLLVGNDICADFDHLPYGKDLYRVSVPDLTILKANWNITNGPDPNCFDGY